MFLLCRCSDFKIHKMWGREFDKIYYFKFYCIYISFSFTWVELKQYVYLRYFILFILKIVNTRSDEIQALIESKLEVKFKELQLGLMEEVKKLLLKLFRLKLKKLLKWNYKKAHVLVRCTSSSAACEKPEVAEWKTPPKMWRKWIVW